MSARTENSWVESSVSGEEAGEEISFQRSIQPGALVTVTIGKETIHVRAEALLAAVKLMQL